MGILGYMGKCEWIYESQAVKDNKVTLGKAALDWTELGCIFGFTLRCDPRSSTLSLHFEFLDRGSKNSPTC